MKVSVRSIFVLWMLFTALISAQNTTTSFPFGAYIGGYHGIRDGIADLSTYENSIQGSYFENWNEWMGINNHYLSFESDYNNANDPINGPIRLYAQWLDENEHSNYPPPIIASTFLWYDTTSGLCFEGYTAWEHNAQPGFSTLSEGHYLYFDKIITSTSQTIDENSILISSDVLDTFELTINPLNEGFQVINDGAEFFGALIDDIQVKGSHWNDNKYTNLHSIRPRVFNTRESNSSAPDTAVFYISMEIEMYDEGEWSNLLHFYLTDQYHSYIQDPTIFFPSGNTIEIYSDTFEIPFYLIDNTNDNYNDALSFGPKLEVFADLSPNCDFVIKNVKIYDEMGKAVVEDDYLGSNPEGYTKIHDYSSILTNAYSRFNKPIISLCDESTIGNFAVMKTVRDYIEDNMVSPSPYFYVTAPEGIYKPILRRFFNEFGTSNLYIAPDPYRIGNGSDSTNYSAYIDNLVDITKDSFNRTLKSVREVTSELEYSSSSLCLYSVPQAHQWDGLRAPSVAEIIAEGYLSLLNNYKGILYYAIHAHREYETIYHSYDISDGSYNNEWEFLAIEDSVRPEARNALSAVSGFLDTPLINNQSETQGDYLLNADITDFEIVGLDNNYNNIQHYKELDLGDINKAKLIRFDIVNEGTGEILSPNNPALLGVGYFEKNGNANFLISNLDHEMDAAKLRLYFNTTASKFLQVTDLTYGHITNRIYPANGIVLLDLPAKSSIIIEVKNTDEGANEFPKGLSFGVARVENGNTKIILDNNYNSVEGGTEEVEFTVSGTNKKLFYTDYGDNIISQDGICDLGVFFYATTTSQTGLGVVYKVTMYYDIYLQNTNGEFNFAMRRTKQYISRPEIDVPFEIINAYPLVVDRDGLTELGYGLVDALNDEFILKLGNDPLEKESDHYSDNGYILSGKWNGEYSICFFSNNTFYYDKDNDGDLDSEAFIPLNNPKPILGDWYGNDDYEYGVYASDNFYGQGFRLNHSGGTNGYSYFEFPYGISGDDPIVWQSNGNESSASKKGDYEEETIEFTYSLGSYPNPFNPTTTITYSIPERVQVELKVYNILGQEVAVLVNKQQDAGEYKVQFNAQNYSSGVYLCRLQTGDFVKTHKLLLLK